MRYSHHQVQIKLINPNTILQWNINGVRSKYVELLTMIKEFNPKIIALQETKLEIGDPLKIKNYNNVYRTDRNRHGGGICIAVHNSIPSHEIKIKINLEIIACKIMFRNINLTICNVYFNKDAQVTLTELDKLKKLPSPILILGDINGKHPTWGAQHSDSQ